MDHLESVEAAAQEIVEHAGRTAADLGPIVDDPVFQKDGRWVFFWRKDAALHYSLQGRIAVLPAAFLNSASAFRGMWGETGSLESIGDACVLLQAWLLDRVDVDDLPPRRVLRSGIE